MGADDYMDGKYSVASLVAACRNCGVVAEDWFREHGDDIPAWVMYDVPWYCSESCYEEDTKIVAEDAYIGWNDQEKFLSEDKGD